MKNSNKYKIIHLIFFFKKTLLKKLPKNQPLKLTRLRYLISVFLLSHDFFFCLFVILRQGLILHRRRSGTHCVVQAHFALMVILLPQLQSARISGVNTQAHAPNSCFAWTWLVVGTNHQVFFFSSSSSSLVSFSLLFSLSALSPSLPSLSFAFSCSFSPPPAPTSSQCSCPGWPWTPGFKQFSLWTTRTPGSGHHCWSHFFITVLKILQASGVILKVLGT